MTEARGAHISQPREWMINIKRDLEPFVKTQQWPKPRKPILRVESRLRESLREQFVPQYLFLGLYNRSSSDNNNPKSKGNIFRLAVVGAFLADSGKTLGDWENICKRIVEDPKAILEQYNEEGLDDLSIEDVRNVLTLDAIFLACFLNCFFDIQYRWRAGFRSIVTVFDGESSNFRDRLIYDILKLENQIPLVLIRKALFLLYEIFNEKRGNQRLEPTENSGVVGDAHTQSEELLQVMCTRLATAHGSSLPGSHGIEESVKYNFLFKDKCKHLLHCVYLILVSEESDETGLRMAPCFNPRFNQKDDPPVNASAQPNALFIPLAPVSQLRKAGIDVRGHAGLDVRFQKHMLGATLFLPRILYLGDNSEQRWRNLLAFEIEHELGNQFQSYLVFMDELIDFEEDVELLRRGKHPVIVNIGVGSNAEVARIFNCMTTGYYFNSGQKWHTVRRQILDYYNNKNRHLWVEFRRTNFGKPWLFASLLAAFVLLVLTFLQTLFAILS